MHIHRCPMNARSAATFTARINNWGSHTRVRRSNELAAASEMHPQRFATMRTGGGEGSGFSSAPPRSRICNAEPPLPPPSDIQYSIRVAGPPPGSFSPPGPESMPINPRVPNPFSLREKDPDLVPPRSSRANFARSWETISSRSNGGEGKSRSFFSFSSRSIRRHVENGKKRN